MPVGGTEDRSFLQGLQPLSLSQTGVFGWSLPAPFGNSFSNGYHTSQDWCWGSQNRLCFGECPASGLAHSRHPARELGAPRVLQERIHHGTSHLCRTGRPVLDSRMKWAPDCSPALGGAAWREPLPLATRPPLSGAERSSFYSLLGP